MSTEVSRKRKFPEDNSHAVAGSNGIVCLGPDPQSPPVQTEGSTQVVPTGLKAPGREVASLEVARAVEVATEGYPVTTHFGCCSNVPATLNGEIR